jgi:hypothetical protein
VLANYIVGRSDRQFASKGSRTHRIAFSGRRVEDFKKSRARKQEDDQVTLCLQRGRVDMDIWAYRFCCTCSQARGEANQPQTRGSSDVESSRAYVVACATVGCVGFVCSHARGMRRHMDPAFLRSGDTIDACWIAVRVGLTKLIRRDKR